MVLKGKRRERKERSSGRGDVEIIPACALQVDGGPGGKEKKEKRLHQKKREKKKDET